MESLPSLTTSSVVSSFVRMILVLAAAVSTTAFIPVTSPIDVNEHNQPREKYFQKQNLVPIECAELRLRQVQDAQLSDQRQHLLQERTAALQQNNDILVAKISSELRLVQRKQSVNLMVMRVLSSIPVHVEFSLQPSSDRVLFLLGQSDPTASFDGHEFEHPRWSAGTITYTSYTSDLPAFIDFRSYTRSYEYWLHGDKPIVRREPKVGKFNAPKSDGKPYPSIDPFAFRTSALTEIHEDARAPIEIAPDTATSDCQNNNCVYSLRFGKGALDLTTDQICNAYNSERGAIFSLIADYNFPPFDLRVEYLVGFEATKRAPMTALQSEAINEAIDSLLKKFISDVVGPAQLYLVSGDLVPRVSPALKQWEIDPLRQQLMAFHNSIVSALGHETTIGEVDQYFGEAHLDRYRDIGEGKIQFVFRVADKEATLDFARYPDGVRLLKIGTLGLAK